MEFKGNKSRVIIPIVEMTPMIDVVFLLIIFFMVAAQFAQIAHVDLNLPKEQGETESRENKSTLVINILADGTIVVDNSKGPVTLATLEQLLQTAVSKDDFEWSNITIRSDKDSLTKTLNEVLILLNSQGLSATNIATEDP